MLPAVRLFNRNLINNKMKINVNYISTKYYSRNSIIQWIWMFERYFHIKGFKMRIFGIYINVRENNATYKLIKIAHDIERQRLINSGVAVRSN